MVTQWRKSPRSNMASQYVDSTRTTDRRNAAQRARNAVRASRAHEDAGAGRKHIDLPVSTQYRYRSGKKTRGEPGAGHTRDTRAHKGTGTGLNILSCDYRDFLWCGVRVRAVRAARAASSPAAPSLSPPLSSPSLPPPLSKAHASPDRSAHQGSSLINKVPRIGTRLGRSRKIITAPQG